MENLDIQRELLKEMEEISNEESDFSESLSEDLKVNLLAN